MQRVTLRSQASGSPIQGVRILSLMGSLSGFIEITRQGRSRKCFSLSQAWNLRLSFLLSKEMNHHVDLAVMSKGLHVICTLKDVSVILMEINNQMTKIMISDLWLTEAIASFFYYFLNSFKYLEIYWRVFDEAKLFENFQTCNSTSGRFLWSLPCKTVSTENQTVVIVPSRALLEERASTHRLHSFSEVHTLTVIWGTTLQFCCWTDLCPSILLKSGRENLRQIFR